MRLTRLRSKPGQPSGVATFRSHRSQGTSIHNASTQGAHAQSSKASAHTSWGPWQAWKQQQLNCLGASVAQMLTAPMQTLFNALVMGIALAMPAALFAVVSQLHSLHQHWQNESEISVFVEHNLQDRLVSQLRAQFLNLKEVETVAVISPAQGLASLSQNAGAEDVVAFLKQNPLPPVLIVKPQAELTPDQLNQLKMRLRDFPHVEDVLLDLEWVLKLDALYTLGQKTFWLLTLTLSLAVVLVISITLKLAIEDQREVIKVYKLCGATDAFIRRPFLYLGAVLGALGGVTAVLLVGMAAYWIEPQLTAFEQAFALDVEFHLQQGLDAVYLAADGLVLGILGAWLAVNRYLADIEPA